MQILRCVTNSVETLLYKLHDSRLGVRFGWLSRVFLTKPGKVSYSRLSNFETLSEGRIQAFIYWKI